MAFRSKERKEGFDRNSCQSLAPVLDVPWETGEPVDDRVAVLGFFPDDDDTLFNSVPMIMAHDAASGYLGGGLINAWTKTQSAGMREQLDCGARVFDARPELDEDKGLVWHHGDVTIDYQV